MQKFTAELYTNVSDYAKVIKLLNSCVRMWKLLIVKESESTTNE